LVKDIILNKYLLIVYLVYSVHCVYHDYYVNPVYYVYSVYYLKIHMSIPRNNQDLPLKARGKELFLAGYLVYYVYSVYHVNPVYYVYSVYYFEIQMSKPGAIKTCKRGRRFAPIGSNSFSQTTPPCFTQIVIPSPVHMVFV
jgi:hypothetical protein